MRLLRLLCLIVVVCFSRAAKSQIISSSTNVVTGSTAYTNGLPNDSLFYFCAGQLGSLTATPPGGGSGYNFAWQRFNVNTNSWQAYSTQNNLAVSTISNLSAGGFRVVITNAATGQVVGTDIAWMTNILNNPNVNVQPIPPGCGDVNLSGTITYGSTIGYYNPPTPPNPNNSMIVNNNTQITACFTGTHTYVSDIGFYLVGPSSCGSPVVVLSPNPGTNCNAGNDFTNICFSTESATNFNVCNAPVPLSGTYGSYGAGSTAINWAALNGCDANALGWRLEVHDCVGADVGVFQSGTLTFTGNNALGTSTTITYSNTTINSAINDLACNGTVANWTINGPPASPIVCTLGYEWTANPPFPIPNATSSLNITLSPGPTQTTTFTLSLTGTCSMAGCGNGVTSDSEVYVYNPSAPAVIDDPGFVCINQQPFLLTANLPNGTWSGDGVNPATGQFSPAIAGVGDHVITFTPSGVCEAPTTITITVNDASNPFITNPGDLCELANPITLNVSVPGGVWSGSGITNATTGLFDPGTAGPGDHIISYEIPNSCNNVTTVTIHVDAGPTLNITAPSTICSDSGINTFTVSAAGGSWSGTGIVSPSAGTFDPAIAGLGLHTITYTFPGVCNLSSTAVVNVLQTVNPTITPPDTLCEVGLNTTIYAATSGGTWSGTGIIGAVTGLFSPNVAGPGAHWIYYTIPNTCNSTDSAEVYVAPNIQPVLTAPVSSLCVGEPAFNITATPAGGTFIGSGITSAVNGTFNPATAGGGLQTVTYNYDNGCQTSASINITVTTTISVVTTPQSDLCVVDAPVQLSATPAGGTWSGDVSASGLFNPTTAGVGSHVLTYEYNGACYGVGGLTVNVVAVPTPVINFPNIICGNDAPFNLTAGMTGMWSGTGISNVSTGQFNPAISGVGTFTVFFEYNGVCQASAQASLTVNPPPVVSAGADQQICQGETATFTATPGGWDNVSWSNGSQNATITVSNGGTYTVTATASGCSATDAAVLTVIPMPNLEFGGNREICENTTTTLDAGVVGLWSNGVTASSITVGEEGLYTFVYSNSGCYATDSVRVIVFEKPVFDLGADQSVCPDDPVVLTIPYDGAWSTGASGNTITVRSTGRYYVTVTNGPCRTSDTVRVNILPLPIAYMQPSYEYCKGKFRYLSVYNPVNSDYLWSTGSDSSMIYVNTPGTYSVQVSNICGTADASTIVYEEDCSYSIYIPNTFTPDGDGINDYWQPVVYNLMKYEVNVFDRWGSVVFHSEDPKEVWVGGNNNGDYFVPDGLYFYQIKFISDQIDAGEERGYIFVLR